MRHNMLDSSPFMPSAGDTHAFSGSRKTLLPITSITPLNLSCHLAHLQVLQSAQKQQLHNCRLISQSLGVYSSLPIPIRA